MTCPVWKGGGGGSRFCGPCRTNEAAVKSGLCQNSFRVRAKKLKRKTQQWDHDLPHKLLPDVQGALLRDCGWGGGVPSDALERPYAAGGGGVPPPGPPPPPLPMFEADSQNFASAPSLPRGLKLQKIFGLPSAGTIGGPWEEGGGLSQTPPPFQNPPPPPPLIHPGGSPTECCGLTSTCRSRGTTSTSELPASNPWTPAPQHDCLPSPTPLALQAAPKPAHPHPQAPRPSELATTDPLGTRPSPPLTRSSIPHSPTKRPSCTFLHTSNGCWRTSFTRPHSPIPTPTLPQNFTQPRDTPPQNATTCIKGYRPANLLHLRWSAPPPPPTRTLCN